MKLSVSVPDELWEKLGGRTASASQLVQEALEALKRMRLDAPAFAADLVPGTPELRSAADSVAEKAKAAYLDGFKKGVEAANLLEVRDFETLDGNGWDIRGWIQPRVNGYEDYLFNPKFYESMIADQIGAEAAKEAMSKPQYQDLEQLIPFLGTIIDPWTEGPRFSPGKTYLKGFSNGLKAVWLAAESGEDSFTAADEKLKEETD